MKKKNIKLLGITLILLFTFNIVNEILNFSEIPAPEYKKSAKDINFDKTKEELVDEEIFKEKLLKTSSSYESNLNFSFYTQIVEIANESWSYVNYNVTEGGFGPSLMNQEGFNGTSTIFEFYINGLINASSPTKDILSPNDLTNLRYVSYKGKPGVGWDFFPIIDDGPGKGYCSGYTYLNETVAGYGASYLYYTNGEFTNITYNATLFLINAISNKTVKTTFIPTVENTQSDFIEWEMNFDNKYFYNYYGQWQRLPDEYKASIKLDNSFTISSALGKSGAYWNPLNYDRNSTHLTIYRSYEEYKINFYIPNLISATFNDNLTIPNIWTQEGKNELHLNVTCKMEGNLTIRFTDSNGTTFENKHDNVKKNEIINYNYRMLNYSKGGIGLLNITLFNGSDVYFGIKLAEIAFHKRSQIIGFTDNTTAFEPNFYLGAVLLDWDYVNYLAYKEGKRLDNDPMYVFNKTMIPNATVSYSLIHYSGELPYVRHPVPGLNLWLYLLGIDLRELQIPPDEYNITFKSSKLGYESSEYVVKPFVVSKRPAIVEIVLPDTELEIEEKFSLTVNLIINYTYFYEYYLRIPAYVNLTFINNETGEVDGPKTYPIEIVQSFTINSQVSNDTSPGTHIVNVTLVSDYYQGSNILIVKVIKKPLSFSFDYDEDDFIEGEEFEVSWALQGGFAGNHENMTLEIYIDNALHSKINLGSGSSGITKFELDKGEYTLTYKIVSPFYTAVTSVKIEVVKEETPEPSWIEQNWIWLVVGVILIVAFAIFAVFMVISRHKIKVKRGLESELITLKNRLSSTETAINTVEAQIAQIVSIYWILVVHSEQGTTMVEIDKFYFEKILGENQRDLIGKGEFRDSALIGGFLTAIRSFSRETSGTSMVSQPIFNSETDYSTVVDNLEIHRRILEGTNYFMAFVSTKTTSAISGILSGINSLFEANYGKTAKEFLGSVSEFIPFRDEVPKFLHEEIRKLQKELKDQRMLLEHYGRHLNQVQDKIGIKPKQIQS